MMRVFGLREVVVLDLFEAVINHEHNAWVSLEVHHIEGDRSKAIDIEALFQACLRGAFVHPDF